MKQKDPRPLWQIEQERARKAHQQFVKEAAELMRPKKQTPNPVEPITDKLFRVVVSRDAYQLWNHIDLGIDDQRYGLAALQTNEQLAETVRYGPDNVEQVQAALDELVEKRLIRIEERRVKGETKRYINTTTPRTCGL